MDASSTSASSEATNGGRGPRFGRGSALVWDSAPGGGGRGMAARKGSRRRSVCSWTLRRPGVVPGVRRRRAAAWRTGSVAEAALEGLADLPPRSSPIRVRYGLIIPFKLYQINSVLISVFLKIVLYMNDNF